MLPELGLFCLIMALGLNLLQIIAYFTRFAQLNLLRSISLGQTLFINIAFITLVVLFLQNDFSVLYVANNSNSTLPWYYKITAVWGGHEGSLLLWLLILSYWTLAVTLAASAWSRQFSNAVLVSLCSISTGFLALILFSSNPFVRNLISLPIDGADLNPMLQDIGMISHPPVLYVGYVGCAVGFAFAVAALLTRQIDIQWAQRLRPWVLTAWSFLTLGIALGSWWAYYELGWGGWWFWDPVENASFMPWLTTTALLHCLFLAVKQARLLLLALFLAIISFGLSLLGTFLVRSGSINSIHAFANDPQRGLLILQFFTLVVGGALFLFAIRTKHLIVNKPKSHKTNRITRYILANNILLMVATAAVLIGTLYPLFYEYWFHATIAVGYQYFNAVFIPLACIMLGIMMPAIEANKRNLFIMLFVALLCAVGFIHWYFGKLLFSVILGLSLALGIIFTSIRSRKPAMLLAHIGLAITVIGITLTPAYEIERDVRMRVGDKINLANYMIQFDAIKPSEGANYVGYKANFSVYKDGKLISVLHPEKRLFLARELPMSETAIFPGLLQDIYIALGQPLEQNSWSAYICYKPFVRWIWIGAIIMACGGLLAAVRSRFLL